VSIPAAAFGLPFFIGPAQWRARAPLRELDMRRANTVVAAETPGIGLFDDVADKIRTLIVLRKREFSLRPHRGQAQNGPLPSCWHGLCYTMCFDAEIAIT
jgi:hypothetical protein